MITKTKATTRNSSPTRNSSARRQEILDTATTVFAEKGIIATTVRDISERAGILSGSLYHHFTSKEEMIADILVPIITSQVDAIDRIVSETDDPTEILRRMITVAIGQTSVNPGAAQILRQDEHHIRDLAGLDNVTQQRRAMRDRVERVIAQGVTAMQFRADVNPRIAALAFFDAVLGAYRHLTPIGKCSQAEVTEQLTTFILQGLRAT
jgi:TetR/AcrR family transcriptional regulator, cholesterol catabolism regulator